MERVLLALVLNVFCCVSVFPFGSFGSALDFVCEKIMREIKVFDVMTPEPINEYCVGYPLNSIDTLLVTEIAAVDGRVVRVSSDSIVEVPDNQYLFYAKLNVDFAEGTDMPVAYIFMSKQDSSYSVMVSLLPSSRRSEVDFQLCNVVTLSEALDDVLASFDYENISVYKVNNVSAFSPNECDLPHIDTIAGWVFFVETPQTNYYVYVNKERHFDHIITNIHEVHCLFDYTVNNGLSLIYTSTDNAIRNASVAVKTILYPNPSSDVITIESEKQGILYIYDMQGRVVMTKPISETKTQINISDLQSGVYRYVFGADNGLVLKR